MGASAAIDRIGRPQESHFEATVNCGNGLSGCPIERQKQICGPPPRPGGQILEVR